MSVLTVGASEQFATIQAAVAASQAGDTIEIDAGTYTASDLKITHDLTIEAAGDGPVNVVAPDAITYGGNVAKGIFIVGTEGNDPNVTIEGLSFSGAKSAQSNGAGIRYQSGNLTLVNDTFHDNQDGILATPFVQNTGDIIVQGSTFDHNGAGDGQSHNIYVHMVHSFTLENSVSENAKVGHEVKSRAYNNIIENNQIIDTATGTASYAIDLPDGGNNLVQGNTIEKGPDASTKTLIHIGGGEQQNGGTTTITGNTLINDYVNPKAVIDVYNQTNDPNVIVQGNTLEGPAPHAVLVGLGTVADNVNVSTTLSNAALTPLPDAVQTTLLGANVTTDFRGDTDDHTITLKAYQGVIGGAGHLTVTATTGDVVVGGSGGLTDTGGFMIYTLAGSSNQLTVPKSENIFSAGNDTINITSAGKAHVSIDGTATVTTASLGSSSYYISGTATVHEVNVYHDGFVLLPGGVLNVDGTAKNNGFSGQGGTVNFNSSKNVGTLSGYFDAGSDQVATMSITTWKNPFAPNVLTLKSGNYSLGLDGGGFVDASADTGKIKIVNTTEKMSFIGGSGNATVYTGSGAANITMGSGTATVSGVKVHGASAFEIDLGVSDGGTMTVQDFKSGTDQVVLGQGVTITNQQYTGGALHIDTSNNAHLILTGVKSL